jgi:ABC-2 type transport system permease protein
MTFSMKRVNAIFQKDCKDISKNLAVSITALIPLILAVTLGKMGNSTMAEHYMVIDFTMVFVGSFVQCSLIAEEKEKNTLRGLMMSPASIMEILGGKSLLSFIATILVVVIGSFLTGYKPDNLFIIAVAIMLNSFFFIGLGTLLGLITKSVMEASIIILPVMLLFSFGAMFKLFAEKYPILGIMDYTPNMQLLSIAKRVESGIGFAGVWLNLGIIALWVIAVSALTIFVFRKRTMDLS